MQGAVPFRDEEEPSKLFEAILLFLLVFFVLNVTLVSGSMNLIYVITDQVVGFLGGVFNSHLGRDVENKVNAAFLLGARIGPQAIGDVQKTLAGSNGTAMARPPKAGGPGSGTPSGPSSPVARP